jgi:integrase/recombinase XerD
MKNSVTTAIILDKRSKNKDGKYPVKLRVTYNRIPRCFGTKFALTEEEFEKASTKNPRGNYKDIKLELSIIEDKAQKIIDSFPDFSFDKFKMNYGVAPRELRNVYHYYNKKIKDLEKSDRIGSVTVYQYSLNSLKDFFKKPSYLEFKEITPKKLELYEEWMQNKENSVTTVGMYLRALRAIINEAIRDKIIKIEQYPFGIGKYQIPFSKNIKKALTIDKIAKLYNYEVPEFSYQDKAKDFWFFSYLCNGANMTDIARLRYKNIAKETITFIRKKTANSKKEVKPIVVPITEDIERIIEKWGNNDKSEDNYVFSILEKGLSAKQENEKVKWLVKQVNKHMKTISEKTGINEKVTTYTARHSFSTVLKRSGVSTEFISESLGHSDLKTTESYLDSFENDIKREYANFLTAFKNKNNAKPDQTDTTN